MGGEVDGDQGALFISEEGDASGGHGEVEADIIDAVFFRQDLLLVKGLWEWREGSIPRAVGRDGVWQHIIINHQVRRQIE